MDRAQSFLSVSVGDTSTLINYIVDGHVLVSHVHPIGYKHIEAEGMNVIASSKFMDGILYTLEFISLHDRIPTEWRLIAPRYATKDVPLSYARHSQTIHSFKV